MNRLTSLVLALCAACAASFAHPASAGLVISLRFADGTTSKDISNFPTSGTLVLQVWATVTAIDTDDDDDGLGDGYFGVVSGHADTGHLTGGLTPASAVTSQFEASDGTSSNGSIGDRNADSIADWGGTLTLSTGGWGR